jgi:hypothetical protein
MYRDNSLTFISCACCAGHRSHSSTDFHAAWLTRRGPVFSVRSAFLRFKVTKRTNIPCGLFRRDYFANRTQHANLKTVSDAKKYFGYGNHIRKIDSAWFPTCHVDTLSACITSDPRFPSKLGLDQPTGSEVLALHPFSRLSCTSPLQGANSQFFGHSDLKMQAYNRITSQRGSASLNCEADRRSYMTNFEVRAFVTVLFYSFTSLKRFIKSTENFARNLF